MLLWDRLLNLLLVVILKWTKSFWQNSIHWLVFTKKCGLNIDLINQEDEEEEEEEEDEEEEEGEEEIENRGYQDQDDGNQQKEETEEHNEMIIWNIKEIIENLLDSHYKSQFIFDFCTLCLFKKWELAKADPRWSWYFSLMSFILIGNVYNLGEKGLNESLKEKTPKSKFESFITVFKTHNCCRELVGLLNECTKLLFILVM